MIFDGVRSCFVLGAGASYASGLPLVNEFFSDQYLKWLFAETAAVNGCGLDADEENRLFRLATKLRGLGGNVELLLNSPDHMVREEVLSYVLDIVGGATDNLCSRPGGSAQDLLTLALFVSSLNTTEPTPVISFNYDYAFENAISVWASRASALGLPPSGGFDYALNDVHNVHPDPNVISFGSALPVQYARGSSMILKPHGSVNLLLCHRCGQMYYHCASILLQHRPEIMGTPCTACGLGTLDAFIVPPSRHKKMPSVLSYLWALCKDALNQADRVFLIGYSIPEYDLEVRELLGQVLVGKEVVLVDPRPARETIDFLKSVAPREVHLREETSLKFMLSELRFFGHEGLKLVSYLAKCDYNAPQPTVSRYVHQTNP